VLAAVAEGNSTSGGIAGYLERKATDISHHLALLTDAGLLTRDADAFRPGRSTYQIREPLIAFYHAIMRPEWRRLERRGQADQVWHDSARRFAGNVVSPRFEQLCRDWVQDYAPPEVSGGVVAYVGHGSVNDPDRKTSHEVDVAVFGYDQAGQRVLLARPARVRELLARSGQPGAETARLLCFGGTEPSGQLRAAVAEGAARFIGLADLYT
jgi:hypothetical protein